MVGGGVCGEGLAGRGVGGGGVVVAGGKTAGMKGREGGVLAAALRIDDRRRVHCWLV